MEPPAANEQAFDTSVSTWFDVVNLIEMAAGLTHRGHAIGPAMVCVRARLVR